MSGRTLRALFSEPPFRVGRILSAENAEDTAKRIRLLAILQNTSLVAYDSSRDVEERFRAMMEMHLARWGVTHRTEGVELLVSRENIAKFVRKALSSGDFGIDDEQGALSAGGVGIFPILRRTEKINNLDSVDEVLAVPVHLFVWLLCVLASEFKLPDLKAAQFVPVV